MPVAAPPPDAAPVAVAPPEAAAIAAAPPDAAPTAPIEPPVVKPSGTVVHHPKLGPRPMPAHLPPVSAGSSRRVPRRHANATANAAGAETTAAAAEPQRFRRQDLRQLLAVAIVATSSTLAHGQVASSAFQQAEALEKQVDKWAEACPLYETSYIALISQIGVLLYLARCHEQHRPHRHVPGPSSTTPPIWPRRATIRAKRRRATTRTSWHPSSRSCSSRCRRSTSTASWSRAMASTSPRSSAPTSRSIPASTRSTARAPGYLPWRTTVTIADQSSTALDLPLLQKAPDAPVNLHEGAIKITTQADAEIILDTKHVGVGSYAAKLRAGGHTLRVVAPGMRPYQTEIVVGEDEERAIDVPLETEAGAVIASPGEDLPHWEIGFNLAPGQKEHGDRPAIISYRLELARRIGRRVNLGAFVEYASVNSNGNCGTSIPSPIPATQFDFGARTQFDGCRYFMIGLQLYVHLRPKRQIDPYVGISPGFRGGFVDYTPYNAAAVPGYESTQFMPGIAVGIRGGVDYHLTTGWEVGAFVDTQIMVKAMENLDSNNGDNGATYVSLFGGLRTTIQF